METPTEQWKHDHEFEDHVLDAVTKCEKGYELKQVEGWTLWIDDPGWAPKAGDTARFFGLGTGYPVRGVVIFPKRGGVPLVARYQSPEDHEAEQKVQSEAYQREVAARVKQPRVEAYGRIYDEAMGEISGFGGGYEEACRRMVLAGLKWFDAHPNADPKFQGYKNIYGVIHEENKDAKALSAAIVAEEDGCSGAMHQAACSHVLAVRRMGWDAYRAKMMEPDEEKSANG